MVSIQVAFVTSGYPSKNEIRKRMGRVLQKTTWFDEGDLWECEIKGEMKHCYGDEIWLISRKMT